MGFGEDGWKKITFTRMWKLKMENVGHNEDDKEGLKTLKKMGSRK